MKFVKRFDSLQFVHLIDTDKTQTKHRQDSMPRMGSEPKIPVSVRAKILHALDRPTSVIDSDVIRVMKL
jgi:hypothetical protein